MINDMVCLVVFLAGIFAGAAMLAAYLAIDHLGGGKD